VTQTPPAASPPSAGASYALTIGTFDGVHLGHQEVLHRTVASAERRNLTPAALTFVPHPRTVVRGGEQLPYLMPLGERVERIRQTGVRQVLVQEFDRSLAQLSAREFFEQLGARLRLRHLVVGEDFRIGRGREAGANDLAELGRSLGWTLESVPPVVLDGAPVSSTRIRSALTETGDVEVAARLLGRPFELSGVVVEGFGRGRSIGVPTANVRLPGELAVPRNGVYFCTASVPQAPDARLPGVLNIGIRPTFDAGARSVELHLLDWSGDLYGQRVGISFRRRLRDERKFESVDALVQQIGRDIALARALAVQAASDRR
jgi:riboflavin kinase/FMN adenylyltransferase